MKNCKRLLLLLVVVALVFSGCANTRGSIIITNGESCTLEVGQTLKLNCQTTNVKQPVVWSSTDSCVTVTDSGLISAVRKGSAVITASAGKISAKISVTVVEVEEIKDIVLSVDKQELVVGEIATLSATYSDGTDGDFTFEIVSGKEFAEIADDQLTAIAVGQVTVVAKSGEEVSNQVTIEIISVEDVGKIELRASKYYIVAGETVSLNARVYPQSENVKIKYEVVRNGSYTQLDGNVVTGVVAGGSTVFVAKVGNVTSNEISVTVVADGVEPTSISLSINKHVLEVGEKATLTFSVSPSNAASNVEFDVIEGNDNVEVVENQVVAFTAEQATIVAKIGNIVSNAVTVNQQITSDPYENITKDEFYSNYQPATSYLDSYYRTLHNFMSGDISAQDQAPTVADYQPAQGDALIRNTATVYAENGNVYYVLDGFGEVVNCVYKGGAYVTLEEVAAYVMAFGEIPANYTSNKSGNPKTNVWGEYLRLNHSAFSGDTSRYRYEPELPDISGCGGNLYYYEIDIGTTGTDCDPSYAAVVYNDGSKITRGAARIVYARQDRNRNNIIDPNERYVFYTYNHYNDFQEYLNYQGGWGVKFGNITGGGTISSNTNYNPTRYERTARADFTTFANVFYVALATATPAVR